MAFRPRCCLVVRGRQPVDSDDGSAISDASSNGETKVGEMQAVVQPP